ncbi:hypothetical protein [Dyella choica]|uniref:Uncharacterized protein n=1 Tax=Dyella choica TaxID=1927959 RepID=A0A3S0RZD6_9GAMM|nr:hypothetical protein [Dyella choica]RUL74016.1 hypothetical protein EKH80_14365 [Dyella choica]
MHAAINRLQGVRLQPIGGRLYLYTRRRHVRRPFQEQMVDKSEIIPVVLFLCITLGITYIARLLVNARLRTKMLQTCSSKELVEAIVQGDAHRDQMTALRWGILTGMEAIGFGVIQAMGWTDINPGVVAMLLGAFGLGSVLFFVLARRFS